MSTDKPATSPDRRRRRRVWLIGVPLAVLLIFVLVVFVLPTPIARHVIESQLASLGIKHNGIETIDINLWNSRVRAGPLTFGAGDGRLGEIGGAGFDYRLSALFEGRALVTTFYLRGVDLFVARQKDGAIVINGVNLKEIAESGRDKPGHEGTSGSDGRGFQAGVERFEFSDSQLLFEDVTGGVLMMTLQRLTLERLRTWTPEAPTAFTLEARLNEMTLALDGTVVPLSNPLRVTLNSRITDVTLGRVARFVGPTGLARQEGHVDTEVQYAYSIHRDGRIEGTVDGTYHLRGLDIATPAGEQAKVGEAVLKVDLRQELAADGSATAAGELTLDASSLSVSTASGDSVSLAGLAFAVDEVDFSKLARERQPLLEAAIAIGGGEAPAQAPSIIELMIGWARDLGLNALKHYLAIDGKPRLTLTNAVVRTVARDGVPAQDIGLDKGTLSLGTLTSEAVDAGWNAKAGLDAMLRGLRVAGEGGGIQAELVELNAQSRTIDLAVTTKSTSLGFDLKAALEQLGAANRDGASLTLAALALETAGLSIKVGGDTREASGPIALTLDDLAASGTGADDAVKIRGRSVVLNLSPFALSEMQSQAVRFGGSVQADGIGVARGGASPLSVSLAAAKVEVNDVRVAPLDAGASIEGGVSTGITDIRVSTGKGADALSLSFASIETKTDQLKASGFDGERPGVEMAGLTRLRKLEASMPLGEGRRASASMASLDAPLTKLELAGQVVRAAGALEARGIALKTEEKPPQKASIAQLSITELRGDSSKGVEMKRVAIGELVAALQRPPARGDAGKSTRFDKSIKLGEVSVSRGSRIGFTDPSVKPPLRMDVVVEKLTAGPIDTKVPATRTKLALAASLNKTAKAALEGWASPFADKVDFDLTLELNKLALPILSPYAASMAGVDLESGVLDAGVKAKASAGALDGKIDLVINDLFVVPVSKNKGAEIAASIGVPAGFAVSVLKDAKGVIKFGLPLSGTLDAPKVDYSEAINKAIGGAIASILPTGWFAADGNSFQMKPATFVAGTADLTEEGKAVADQMSKLFTQKSGISIRVCGRAARADLIAQRNAARGTAARGLAPGSMSPPQAGAQAAPRTPLAEPNEGEVKELLALATKRGATIRQYLQSTHGISAERIPECRTAYSMEDGKQPRAEFQF